MCPSPTHLVHISVFTEMSITTQPLQEQLQDLKVQLETKVRVVGVDVLSSLHSCLVNGGGKSVFPCPF